MISAHGLFQRFARLRTPALVMIALVPAAAAGIYTASAGKWLSRKSLLAITQHSLIETKELGKYQCSVEELAAYPIREMRDIIYFQYGTQDYLLPRDDAPFLRDVRFLSGSTDFLQLNVFARSEASAEAYVKKIEAELNEKYQSIGTRLTPVPPAVKPYGTRLTFEVLSTRENTASASPSAVSDALYTWVSFFLILLLLRTFLRKPSVL